MGGGVESGVVGDCTCNSFNKVFRTVQPSAPLSICESHRGATACKKKKNPNYVVLEKLEFNKNGSNLMLFLDHNLIHAATWGALT